ncbi:hypothetical protein [Anaeroselena agilis]|uniref:Uncharacterized protein n=1 Tax=Anaeroselena agilis TaxID=3063788 RepID=A0ABU3NX58_9FIRM|nr:hypothetical protein [Selenomonadales bacterium 4137-cl]
MSVWKEEARFYGRIIMVAALVVAVIFAWHYFAKQDTVRQVSQENAATVAGQKKAAESAGLKLGDKQASEAAKMIEKAASGPPDEVIPSTGGTVKAELDKIAAKSGGYLLVTDPAAPQKAPKVDALSPDKPLNLNVYGIKPYPKRLLEVTLYPQAADVALLRRVTVFKRTGYLGPAVSYDADRRSKLRIGVRLSVPLD